MNGAVGGSSAAAKTRFKKHLNVSQSTEIVFQTVNVISNDPPFEDGNARFATVSSFMRKIAYVLPQSVRNEQFPIVKKPQLKIIRF